MKSEKFYLSCIKYGMFVCRMCSVKAVGIETGGLEIDLEREAILEMLKAPLNEEMKDAIEKCKGKLQRGCGL